LDFYVNHFSGWAHWHRRHTVSQVISNRDGAFNEDSTNAPEDIGGKMETVRQEATMGAESNTKIIEQSTVTNDDPKTTKSGSRKLLSGLDIHSKRSKELSRLMDLECRNLINDTNIVDRAMALVPFWSHSAESSGGNAHFNAVDSDAALQVQLVHHFFLLLYFKFQSHCALMFVGLYMQVPILCFNIRLPLHCVNLIHNQGGERSRLLSATLLRASSSRNLR